MERPEIRIPGPQFVSSYQGAAEYVVGPYRVEIRTFAHPNHGWNTGVYDREIKPSIGTIRLRSTNGQWGMHEFPPADVCALFPEYVPARYREDWTTEYQGPAPELGIQGASTEHPQVWAMGPLRAQAAKYEWMAAALARCAPICPLCDGLDITPDEEPTTAGAYPANYCLNCDRQVR